MIPHRKSEDILRLILGVPLLQEQVMNLMIYAGYSPEGADGLRRSMATGAVVATEVSRLSKHIWFARNTCMAPPACRS